MSHSSSPAKCTPEVLGRASEDAVEDDPPEVTEESRLTLEEARAPGRRALDSKAAAPSNRCIAACLAVLVALLLSLFALVSFFFAGPDTAAFLPPKRAESCKRMELVPQPESGNRDGVWPVCMDFLPSTDCVVYTGGLSNDVRFEVGMVPRGCEVHTFEPTLEDIKSQAPRASETVRSAERSGVHFHPWALGGKDEVVEAGKMPYTWPGIGFGKATNSKPWEMKTLRGLMETLKHAKIDVLKLDIEGAEWLLLEAALKDPISRRALERGRVRQIVMEVHFMPPIRSHYARSPRHPYDWEARNMHFRDLLRELEKLGYRMFWHEPSRGNKMCHNIGLIWQGSEGAH